MSGWAWGLLLGHWPEKSRNCGRG